MKAGEIFCEGVLIIMMKFQKFVTLVSPILALLLTLTPSFLFPVCHYDSYMECYYAGGFVMMMGIGIGMFSWHVSLGFSSSVFNVLSSIAALMAILVPYRIITLDSFRLCDDTSHACRSSTMPAVIVIASLIIILNMSCIIINFRRRNED